MRTISFRILFLFLLYYISLNPLLSQIDCDSSIVFCEVIDLNGFSGSLPDSIYSEDKPSSVCSGDGVVDNPVWISFVAPVSDMEIIIKPDNCTMVNGDKGIQATLYDDCTYGTIIDCSAEGISFPDSIVLSSTTFVPGHVYKLLLDGWSGSICDFEIIVRPDTTFEPTAMAIEYDLVSCFPNSICAGANIEYTLTGLNFDTSYLMSYYWTIDPPTVEYPTGVISTQDTIPSIIIHFSEPGDYTISCFAYGECDSTAVIFKNVHVDSSSLWNEYFQDTIVCQEDFPTLGPIGEDPNGDGVYGWLGGFIMGEGQDSFEVVTDCGCRYMQYINIVQIDLSPRIEIDFFYCSSDPGPHIFNGMPITEDVVALDTSLTASSGCDSLVRFNATFIDITGDLSIEGCSDSLKIGVINEFFKPLTYDQITYIWYDDMGIVVTDLNSDDASLKVTSSGAYSLGVTMTIGSVICEHIVDTILVDFTSLVPDQPTVQSWAPGICEGTDTLTYLIENPDVALLYTWSWPVDVIYISGQGTSEIMLDWSVSNGGMVTVTAANLCGDSPVTELNISFEALPSISFDLVDSLCINEIYTLVYSGDIGHGYNYNWSFDNATVTSGVNEGPFELSWNTGGLKSISLNLTKEDCQTTTVTEPIFIVDKLVAPELICNSVGGELIISWEINPLVTEYHVVPIEGKLGTLLNGNSYKVNGLSDGETVKIRVFGDIFGYCSATYEAEIECVFEDCPSVTIQWPNNITSFCVSEDETQTIDVTIIGDDTGIGILSGSGIIGTNGFNPAAALVGENIIHYNYEVEGCNYEDSITISVFPLPTGNIEIFDPTCYDDAYGTVIVHSSPESGPLMTSINGSSYGIDSVFEVMGVYTIEMLDINDCIGIYENEMFAVDKPDVLISGTSTLSIGDEVNLILQSDIDVSRVDSIIWFKDDIEFCNDCTLITNVFETNFEEYCVEVYYDGQCIVRDCFTITEISQKGLYFPTIFTPSSQDENSNFIIDIGRQTATLRLLEIYDHWGNQLYAIKNQSISGNTILWDGHFKGEIVLPGVYVYVFEIEYSDGKIRSNVGDVTVIR